MEARIALRLVAGWKREGILRIRTDVELLGLGMAARSALIPVGK